MRHIKFECSMGEELQQMMSHAFGGLAGSWRTLLNRAAGRRHGRHLESVSAYHSVDSVNRCVFTSRTVIPNFIPIRFETTDSDGNLPFLKSVSQQTQAQE